MLKLNAHARIEIAAIVTLALGSCAGPPLTDRQKDEVADIAADAAADMIADNETISDLEGRVSEIESRLGM